MGIHIRQRDFSERSRVCSSCCATLPPEFESCSDTLCAFAERIFPARHSQRVVNLPNHCWSLQHPLLQTPQDISWDLMLLCQWVEFDTRGDNPTWVFQVEDWLWASPAFPYPFPYANLGPITVTDLYWAPDEKAVKQVVESWASSVWEAWVDYHAWARDQLKQYIF